MQDFGAEVIALPQSGAGEDPMPRIDHLVRRDGHRAEIGKDHAQQIGFRFDRRVKAAFEFMIPAVQADHAAVGREFDLAVDAVAPQVEQFAAALKNPRLTAQYIGSDQYSGWTLSISTR